MAYTRRGLAQVDLLAENVEQFPFLRRFNATNYRVPYPYRIPGTAATAVWGLQEDQVSRKNTDHTCFSLLVPRLSFFDLFLSLFSS